MASITIEWRAAGGDAASMMYVVNGREVGVDRAGVDATLSLIRDNPTAPTTVKLSGPLPPGVKSAIAGAAFYGEIPIPYDELHRALGSRQLNIDL